MNVLGVKLTGADNQQFMNIEKINIELATKTPIEIVQWALNNAETPIVTTNFRPYESAILHLVTQ